MLEDFIAANRDLIIARTRKRVGSRPWPSISSRELEHGVPLFLTQLTETLRFEATATPYPENAIASTARHGGELLGAGFTVSQVVHDYGDICQAVTEIAMEEGAPITVDEFHTLDRCLDTAIAETVSEYARVTVEKRAADEAVRQGQSAHELRDALSSAILAFHMRRHPGEQERRVSGLRRPARRRSVRAGSGLSIARKAIEAQGGQIHVRNTPGRGCVFAVEMPMGEPARMLATAN